MPLPIRVTALRRGDRLILEQWVRARTTPRRVLERARIVLASADGHGGDAICALLGVSRPTVSRWLDRYDAEGAAGLEADRPRSGRPKQIGPAQEAAIIDATLHTTPPDQGTHWSTRLMATQVGVHQTTVARIWRSHGLKPHLVETFKVSTDPDFVAKLRDVVGLYVDPPKRAVVVSVDEKSQIQALDRTQPILPLRPGLPERQTHDYQRHGTTTLFAALNVLEGTVIGLCQPRQRHQEFIRFLETIEAATDPALDLHLVLDNYATHKHPKVRAGIYQCDCNDKRAAPD